MTPEQVGNRHRQQVEDQNWEHVLNSLADPVGGKIGSIANAGGFLYAKKDGERYFWALSTYKQPEWEEISEALFKELLRHNKSK